MIYNHVISNTCVHSLHTYPTIYIILTILVVESYTSYMCTHIYRYPEH